VERFLSERYNLNISHGISDEAMGRVLADAKASGARGPTSGRLGGPPG
jgi:hypothetical protein